MNDAVCQTVFACKSMSVGKPHIVLLHGWGSSCSVWSALAGLLEADWTVHTVDLVSIFERCLATEKTDELLQYLHREIPDGAVLCGWSLGGVLASLYAQRYPLSVRGLITIACTPQFIADQQWPFGMTVEAFSLFFSSAGSPSEQFCRRFWALQAKGVLSARSDLRYLREQMHGPILHHKAGLSILRDTQLFDCWRQISVPVLHMYGDHDELVSNESVRQIRDLYAGHEVMCFDASAHIPFVSEMERCVLAIRHFQRRIDAQLGVENKASTRAGSFDKKEVAASFSRAALTYDRAATLQHKTGERLLDIALEELAKSDVKLTDTLLDIGSGTGRMTRRLLSTLPYRQLFATDIAHGMLQYTRRHHGIDRLVCADMEVLPFKELSIDTCFSNMAFQWCSSPDRILSSLHKALKQGGKVFFSTLLRGTMKELSRAWASVDEAVHVNTFYSLLEWRNASLRHGYSVRLEDVVVEVEYFDCFRELADGLKQIGAHNMNAGRRAGLLGRQHYRAMLAAYEQMRVPTHGLPLTYMVAYFVLEK